MLSYRSARGCQPRISISAHYSVCVCEEYYKLLKPTHTHTHWGFPFLHIQNINGAFLFQCVIILYLCLPLRQPDGTLNTHFTHLHILEVRHPPWRTDLSFQVIFLDICSPGFVMSLPDLCDASEQRRYLNNIRAKTRRMRAGVKRRGVGLLPGSIRLRLPPCFCSTAGLEVSI